MFNKVTIMISLIHACFSAGVLFSSEELINNSPTQADGFDETMVYNFAICTVFNNEAYHLKEWLEHHQNLGVEHIYLYNIGSNDPFYFVLLPYINEGFVTLVNWPGQLEKEEKITSMRISAYENAINFIARKETKWLLILDVNEFLMCPKESINELLLHYDDFSALSLPTYLVDKKSVSNPAKKHQGNFIQKNVDAHKMKMIVKPDLCKGFTWPPYQCRIKDPESIVCLNEEDLRIDHHINRPTKQQMMKDCISKKTLSKFSLVSNPNAIELADIEKTYHNEYIDLPMYNCMPNFLKKLKHQCL